MSDEQSTPDPVTMTCMTTKQKFEVVEPPVIMLANGRYAYRAECPWKGKQGQTLFAFKFCSKQAYLDYTTKPPEGSENEEEFSDVSVDGNGEGEE